LNGPLIARINDVLVLDLSGDVCAHVRRTLPLHGQGAAAARRGQRRAAAVDRSGQVQHSAHSNLGTRSGTAVWSLALAFYRPRGLAVHCSAIVRVEMHARTCGTCSEMAGPCFLFTLLCMCDVGPCAHGECLRNE
jgi:hypothetical protein